MQPSFSRYLLFFGGAMAGVLLLAWLYVALAPMAFMESGYAAWAAKTTMLGECRLGQLALFGDSRLEAGVIPAGLPVPSSNFGLAAGTAVEAHSAVRRAVACPDAPGQAVIALVPEHFGKLSKFFWILSLRYGFLSPGEVLQTESWAARLGDHETLSASTPDGLSGWTRDWLYALRFPSFSFGSLVQGRGFARLGLQHRALQGRAAGARLGEIRRRRGRPRRADGDVRADEAAGCRVRLGDRAAASARHRGVPAGDARSPGRIRTARRRPPRICAISRRPARRIPGVQLVDDAAPVWPDRLFADGAHLKEEGARIFTQRLAACMTGGKLRPGCDFSWRGGKSLEGSAVLEVQQQGDRQH